jgi:hypothetical protein
MARLVILSGALAGTTLELREGRNSVGRTPENDLTIPEEAISRRHCDLWVNGGRLRVQDLHSRNGTFLRGRRVKTAELKEGDVLVLGDIAVRLETPPVEVRIPERKPSERPHPALLEDGRPACWTHSERPAAYTCEQCGRHWCAECMKGLRLVGGRTRIFCPECSGHCQSLGETSAASPPRRRRDRIWATIKRGLTWRSP